MWHLPTKNDNLIKRFLKPLQIKMHTAVSLERFLLSSYYCDHYHQCNWKGVENQRNKRRAKKIKKNSAATNPVGCWLLVKRTLACPGIQHSSHQASSSLAFAFPLPVTQLDSQQCGFWLYSRLSTALMKPHCALWMVSLSSGTFFVCQNTAGWKRRTSGQMA